MECHGRRLGTARPTTASGGSRLLVTALFVLLSVWFGAGVASAHAFLVGSDPAAGAELDTGPSRVALTFNEALNPEFATVAVVGPDGHIWSTGPTTVDGVTASVAVGELGPAGQYTVGYRLVSADGHPVSSSFTFTLRFSGHGTPGPLAPAQPQPVADNSGSSTVLIISVVGLVVLLSAVFPLVFWLRTRHTDLTEKPAAQQSDSLEP